LKGLENPDQSVQQQLNLPSSVIDQQADIGAFVYLNTVQVRIWKVGNLEASIKEVAPILTTLVNNYFEKGYVRGNY
jgi:hypothetical protein